MKELKEKLNYLLSHSNCDPAVIEEIRRQPSIAPFDTEGRLMAYLLSTNSISYRDCVEISYAYQSRNLEKPQYLDLYEMAPRTFGQTWGEAHIRKLFPQFIQATRETMSTLYPSFNGEFDLWLEGIRIEVKACRANSTQSRGSLASRAYSHAEAQKAGFKYHFQQLKPSCCDIFIWIGVCKDALLYWVLTSRELLASGKISSQHRNENTGIPDAGVYEGQVFMTEEDLHPFLVEEADILPKVLEKGKASLS